MSTKEHEATLLMESHGLAPSVRSTSFASTEVWSKLYQAGAHFVDLSLRPGDRGLALRGEILTQSDAPLASGGTAILRDRQGATIGTTEFGGAGENGFLFPIGQSGSYRLEIALDDELLCVGGLEIR